MHFSAGYLIILPVGTDKGLNYTPRSRFWKNALFVQLFVRKHPRKKVVYEEKESNFGGPGKKKTPCKFFQWILKKWGPGGVREGFGLYQTPIKSKNGHFRQAQCLLFCARNSGLFFRRGGVKQGSKIHWSKSIFAIFCKNRLQNAYGPAESA